MVAFEMSVCNGKSKKHEYYEGDKPKTAPPDYDRIPQSLKNRKIWVCWKLYLRKNKNGSSWEKMPVAPFFENGSSTKFQECDTSNPDHGWDFDQVQRFYDRNRDRLSGIGILLRDGVTGLDLDDSIGADGKVKTSQRCLLKELNTYTEISPSGTGVKSYFLADTSKLVNLEMLEGGEVTPKQLPKRTTYAGDVLEVYDVHSARFFTITGNRLDEFSHEVEERQDAFEDLYADAFEVELEALATAVRERNSNSTYTPVIVDADNEKIITHARTDRLNGEKFCRVFDKGDISDFFKGNRCDHSAADYWLCSELCYWVGPDAKRIRELFELSKSYRNGKNHLDTKCVTHPGYVDMTIDNVIRKRTKFYPWNAPPRELTDTDKLRLAEMELHQDFENGTVPPPVAVREDVPAPAVAPATVCEAVDSDDDDGGKGKKKTTVQKAFDIAKEIGEYWRGNDGYGYVTFRDNNVVRHMCVEKSEFADYFIDLYLDRHNDAPSRHAMESVVSYCRSKGKSNRQIIRVRVVRIGDIIYIDLADELGRIIEISADGWKIVYDAPVKFIRSENAAPLPVPIHGGNMDLLRPLLGCADNDEIWIRFKGMILDAFKGYGPYLVGVITGEYGAAKSTSCKYVRLTVDPVTNSALSKLPKDEEEIALSGFLEHYLCYDNISNLRPWMSDTFCQVSTGGGFRSRRKYKNDELFTCNMCNPILLNGIPNFAEMPDLLSRSMLIRLEAVKERRETTDLDAEFKQVQASVFGGICDLLVRGLRDYEKTKLAWKPRQADSCRWVCACMGTTEFVEVFRENEEEAAILAKDSSPIVPLIEEMLRHPTTQDGTWKGPMSKLLGDLDRFLVHYSGRRPMDFPGTPKKLANLLRRDKGTLAKAGIEYIEPHKSDGQRKAILRLVQP